MYIPSLFVEERLDILQSFIRDHPFAIVVTCSPDGPEATHVPMVLHPEIGPKGTLRCHFARPNQHWQAIASSQILVIFHGPHHYITPSWYPSKQEQGPGHGRVVPTWNYVTVHVRGQAAIFDGTQLVEHLRTLTDQNERVFDRRWSIDDTPEGYVEALSKGIVGIEIAIHSIEGKCKLSQNRPKQDQAGVVEGLKGMGTPASLEMAELVARGGLK
jgi:transcriptional regulator